MASVEHNNAGGVIFSDYKALAAVAVAARYARDLPCDLEQLVYELPNNPDNPASPEETQEAGATNPGEAKFLTSERLAKLAEAAQVLVVVGKSRKARAKLAVPIKPDYWQPHVLGWLQAASREDGLFGKGVAEGWMRRTALRNAKSEVEPNAELITDRIQYSRRYLRHLRWAARELLIREGKIEPTIWERTKLIGQKITGRIRTL